MKSTIALIYLACIVLLSSCEKEPYIRFGFDSPIEKNSSGLVIADISHHVEDVCLNGSIRLREGEVEINLINPKGSTVYSKTLAGPGELKINETFEAKSGYWKLKYKSNNGVGEIDLHLFKY